MYTRYEVRPCHYGRYGVYDRLMRITVFYPFGELAVNMSRRSAQVIANTLNAGQ